MIVFNINIFSDYGYINFSEAKIIFKYEPLKIYEIPEFKPSYKIKKFDIDIDPRICEMEVLKNRWKDIKFLEDNSIYVNKINKLFGQLFEIQEFLYDDVGYFLFKIILRANKKGSIENSFDLGIKIKVRAEDEIVKNEVKKNCLVYERRNTLEVRINEILIFYLSLSKSS